MNERNEIKGDAIESIESELLANAPEGERGFPEEFEPLPEHLRNAPSHVLAAWIVAGDDPEEFDQVKEYLRGD